MYSCGTGINFIHEKATLRIAEAFMYSLSSCPLAGPRPQRSYELMRPVLEGIPTRNTVVLLACGFDGLSASPAVWRALRKECSNLNVLVCIMERYTRLRRIEPNKESYLDDCAAAVCSAGLETGDVQISYIQGDPIRLAYFGRCEKLRALSPMRSGRQRL